MAKNEISKLQLDMEQVTRTTSLLNQNQVQKLFNSTPQKFKYKRPAKGGGQWDYVKGSYVRKTLDSVFGFNWDFEVETTVAEAFEVAKMTNSVVVKGILTGRVYKDKEWHNIRKVQFGRADVKWKRGKTPQDTDLPEPLDFGNDMKASATDAFKKTASLFGVASDVYEADEFMEIEIVGSSDNDDKRKLTEQKVEEAKKELEKTGAEDVKS